MPFSDKKIYQLIFSGGIRIAAASLGIQASHLYSMMNFSEKTKGTTTLDEINAEVWFFVGVSLGGLLSVILFLTCF